MRALCALPFITAALMLTGSASAQVIDQSFDPNFILGGQTTTHTITMDNSTGAESYEGTLEIDIFVDDEIDDGTAYGTHYQLVYVEDSVSFSGCGLDAAIDTPITDESDIVIPFKDLSVAVGSICEISVQLRHELPEEFRSDRGLDLKAGFLSLLNFRPRISSYDRNANAASLVVGHGLPVITSNGGGDNADVSIADGSAYVTTVEAIEPDGQTIEFLLPRHSAGRYKIGASDGVLEYVEPPELGHRDVIEVWADDGNGGFDIQKITVTVISTNSSPVITSFDGADSATVKFNGRSKVVATIEAEDADGDTLTFSKAGGADKGLFEIDEEAGTLAFRSPPQIDSPEDEDGDNIYEVIVRVDDDNGGTDTQTLSVEVTGSNNPPVITSDGGTDQAHLAILAGRTEITTVQAIDLDGDEVRYKIVGGGQREVFTINETTGELTLKEPLREIGEFYKVIVEAYDELGGADQQTIWIVIYERGDGQPTVTISGPGETRGPFTATFTFSETVFEFDASDIIVGNGRLSDDFSDTGDRTTFTVTVIPTETGIVTLDVPEGAAKASVSCFPNAAAETLHVRYVEVAESIARTQRVIRNFISRRADHITSAEPDLVARLQGGAGGRHIPLKFNGTPRNNTLAFATGLRRLIRENRQQPSAQASGPSASLQDEPELAARSGRQGEFDVWTEGTWARAQDDAATSDIGLLYVAAEYRIRNEFAVGLLGQFDWTDESSNGDDYDVSGTGWMVGPYVVARLGRNLFFDARLAKGRSDNTVSPDGTYSNDFDGDRLLAKGQLTGRFDVQGVTIAPEIAVIHFEEEQEAYTDKFGLKIGRQKISLGRLTFGPSLYGRYVFGNGVSFRPKLKIQGIWNFKSAGIVDLDTGYETGGSGELRARAEASLRVTHATGWELDLDGFYDGLGADDYEAFGAGARVSFPLQRVMTRASSHSSSE